MARTVGGDHRHRDQPVLRVRGHFGLLVAAELALCERQAGVPIAASRRCGDQRDAGLVGEAFGDIDQALCPGLFDRAPQVLGHSVAVGVRLHVAAKAVAPDVFTGVILEHRDDRLALRIGDRIELLVGLLCGGGLQDDRVGAFQGIGIHRPFARVHFADVDVPVGLELCRGLRFHPAGEAFIEPQVVPPGHRHEIAEPLVCHLVADCGVKVFQAAGAGRARVEQQAVLESEYRAPVLHRAELLRAARRGDVVELGQRIIDAEIGVIVRQDLPGRIERISRRLAASGGRDDADHGIVVGDVGHALEIAHREEQQVARHLRRGGEDHPLGTVAEIRLARHGHVADGHLVRRDDGGRSRTSPCRKARRTSGRIRARRGSRTGWRAGAAAGRCACRDSRGRKTRSPCGRSVRCNRSSGDSCRRAGSAGAVKLAVSFSASSAMSSAVASPPASGAIAALAMSQPDGIERDGPARLEQLEVDCFFARRRSARRHRARSRSHSAPDGHCAAVRW